jgi:hypothetical protein
MLPSHSSDISRKEVVLLCSISSFTVRYLPLNSDLVVDGSYLKHHPELLDTLHLGCSLGFVLFFKQRLSVPDV